MLTKEYLKKYTNQILESKYLAPVILFLCGISVTCVGYLNEVCEGGGDNYWHYYFSKYAPSYPKFFLHHWGKPFFILLSTPFSQFGFFALNVFNILCGIFSAWIAYCWCRKLNLAYSFVVIPMVLFAPVYFEVIQSALTEPLFSLLFILSAYLLFCERYFWGTILASFLMYTRSEGIFIIPIFAFYLLLIRQWKFIPFLATGFLLYSFAGYFSGHNFLWFFTENPYKEISPYGHGEWNHFIRSYKKIFGIPFTYCFLVGLLLFILKLIQNKAYQFWKSPTDGFKLFCLVFIPALTFFLFHTYAWAMGKYASAGLWRVMACIIPLMAVIGTFTFNLISNLKFSALRVVILGCFLFFMIGSAFKYLKYPLKAEKDWKVAREAANWFRNYREPGSTIFYAHVGVTFFCDYDPFDSSNKECYGFPANNCQPQGLNKKFYYFWDSAFSESLCGTKFSDIENCGNMKKVKEFSEGNYKLIVFESK